MSIDTVYYNTKYCKCAWQMQIKATCLLTYLEHLRISPAEFSRKSPGVPLSTFCFRVICETAPVQTKTGHLL